MEDTVELTLAVQPATIDRIKDYAQQKGKSVAEVTKLVSGVIDGLIESALNDNTATFALRPSALQKLNAYAHLRGTSKEEVATEISDTLSDILETVMKEKIAEALGISTAPAPQSPQPRRRRQPEPPQQSFTDTTGISDGLGDEDPDPEMPPAEESEDALVPTEGGLTDADLESDMDVENPELEAKGEASSFGDDLMRANGIDGENLFAEVAGFDKDYVDPRVAKRKKGPTKSRGKVKNLTSEVESEGAGV